MKTAKSHSYAPSLNIAHFELICMMYRMLKSLPTSPKLKHVKRHQDALEHALDLWADMNTLADSRAKLVL